jgi:hypothetical protein
MQRFHVTSKNNTSNHYNVNGCIETPDVFNELQYRSSSVHNRVEPMAFGVNEAFPLAMFHHAKVPCDLQREHLKDMATISVAQLVLLPHAAGDTRLPDDLVHAE